MSWLAWFLSIYFNENSPPIEEIWIIICTWLRLVGPLRHSPGTNETMLRREVTEEAARLVYTISNNLVDPLRLYCESCPGCLCQADESLGRVIHVAQRQDAGTHVVQIQHGAGHTEQHQDSGIRVVQDPNGVDHVVENQDGAGHVVMNQDAVGHVIQNQYGDVHVGRETNGACQLAQNQHDAGPVVQIQEASSHVVFDQDGGFRTAQNEDGTGHVEQSRISAGQAEQSQDGADACPCCASSSVIKMPPSPFPGKQPMLDNNRRAKISWHGSFNNIQAMQSFKFKRKYHP
jgi:hypothetical protein